LMVESENEAAYNKPMPWIGMYIALASLFCILAMVADLLHGFRNRKLWFPCKYFTLNAASLTVIAVAMKLPVDLSNPMLGIPDEMSKLGSMAFMCTMMANFLPSLATMNSKELLTNIIALDILVITLIVNVCIQIYTDVIGGSISDDYKWIVKGIALFYVAMLLILLIIHTCSGLTILNMKLILESKYQAGHETTLKDLELQQPRKLTAEKLNQHVKNHWIMAVTTPGQLLEETKDQYVLQLQGGMELAERTLKGITKSFDLVIQKAEKQQPQNLMKLLKESTGFEGVGKYNNHLTPGEEYLDCWSLPLVTLTSIAISLAKFQKDAVDRLQSSVREGLTYVTLVEESLNATDDYVSIQKAAKVLWLEVEVSNKWVGNNLKSHAPEVNTAGLILQWFKDTAEDMVTEVQRSTDDNSIYRSICANSMSRITKSIITSYGTNIDELSPEDLLMELSSIFADILAACLTNLPQVIVTKCNESVIEKRESSVNAAAQLLGETTQIINILRDREPPMGPADLPFIHKWCAHYNNP
nr:hypothetical protein CTI12_AA089520 [Tanacetum cinerariifolium]